MSSSSELGNYWENTDLTQVNVADAQVTVSDSTLTADRAVFWDLILGL